MVKNQFLENQTKSIDIARSLGQIALENAQELGHINYQAIQEAISNLQSKLTEVMDGNNSKWDLSLLQTSEVQEVLTQITTYQNKIARVLRHSNQELIHAVESATEEFQKDLKVMVEDISSKSPAGSEAYVNAFSSTFNAVIKNFEQVRNTTQDAFHKLEENIETAMHSPQDRPRRETKDVKISLKKSSSK